MTPAEAAIIAKVRRNEPILPADTCATIETEAELEQYRIGLQQRGALTDDALHAIAVRRVEIQRRKGVQGSGRP